MIKKIIAVMAATLLISGCSSVGPMNYEAYQAKIYTCQNFGMRPHVINGIRNSVPYVREVICYDEHGATWDTSRME